MANIKSQIKRNRQNEKRRVRNRTFRGAARTAVNLARTAFVENDPNTKEAVLKAISTLDRAAEQGVLHPNNASRRKGRLMKRLAAFVAAPAVVGDAGAKKKKVAAPKVAAPKVAAPKKEPAKKATTKKAATKEKAA
ncbi:MAG TPA: 30S ribosomal protein S20 [Anaerolineales bacterium]|nr:30S ribosomal protein S20 [Anaerolineales bacterium]